MKDIEAIVAEGYKVWAAKFLKLHKMVKSNFPTTSPIVPGLEDIIQYFRGLAETGSLPEAETGFIDGLGKAVLEIERQLRPIAPKTIGNNLNFRMFGNECNSRAH